MWRGSVRGEKAASERCERETCRRHTENTRRRDDRGRRKGRHTEIQSRKPIVTDYAKQKRKNDNNGG